MQVRITETGAIESLSIIDPQSGMDWTADCIGNSGDANIVYNDDDEIHECDQATFDWWSDYITAQQSADNRAQALREEFGAERVNGVLQYACDDANDIESHPAAINAALDAEFGEDAGTEA